MKGKSDKIGKSAGPVFKFKLLIALLSCVTAASLTLAAYVLLIYKPPAQPSGDYAPRPTDEYAEKIAETTATNTPAANATPAPTKDK